MNHSDSLPPGVTRLIWIGVVIVAVTLVLVVSFDIVKVDGNEVAVKETWKDGVIQQVFGPGTYILNRLPFWRETLYKYDVASRVFAMNDVKSMVETAEGREYDPYKVESQEGQRMTINLNILWHPDAKKIIDLHTSVRFDFEERILRPTVMRVVKDEATVMKAIDAYSGSGLVDLQSRIQKRLMGNTCELADRGIVVENFVIEKIELDDDYVREIKAKQVAIQAKLRADEEKKAADAKAEQAKSMAMADLNTQVVAAERDKQKGVLEAEKSKQMTILSAEADAKQVELAAGAEKAKRVLEAEGEKEAGLLKAQAIFAIGEAEAKATRLKLAAYSEPGSDNFVKVEVAKQMAAGFGGIQGFLPGDMKFNVLSGSFIESLNGLLHPAPMQETRLEAVK
ncbi:MAG: SPFH domain-containing protein [Candidatus Bipolaricaulota bacterium]